MLSPSSHPHDSTSLTGEVVVFSGRLSALDRRDARALVVAHGGETADDVTAKTTILVVADAAASPTDPEADAATPRVRERRAEELIAHGARLRVVGEDAFCALVGRPGPDTLRRQYHAASDLRHRYPAVREDHLRYLTRYGIIQAALRTPGDTYYPFTALAPIRQANEGLQQGQPFRAVVRALTALQAGQLTFDFRLEAEPARIVTLARPARGTPAPVVRAAASDAQHEAESCFREASSLDDGTEETSEAAAAAYRRALEFDPNLVPAIINLANLHYSRDEVDDARALYQRAIALEPDFFEAHFNLANIHHDLGQYEAAQASYREALRLNPHYPDGHFYLAVTLEKMGLSAEARPHWRAYQSLAPMGEWVALAKEFSD